MKKEDKEELMSLLDEDPEIKAPIIDEPKTSLVEVKSASVGKAITDVGIGDINVTIDKGQSLKEQVKDIAGVMATRDALEDEGTRDALKTSKQSELIDESRAEVKIAQKKVIESETSIQKAEREQFEGLLSTFGFFAHYPRWMMKAIVYILTPFFFVIGLVIGIPCGFVKILIDNIDGIMVRYQKTDDKSKPKIKVSILVLLIAAALLAICLTVLAACHII